MKWWDSTTGYALRSDPDVFVGESQGAENQGHRGDREHSQHRRGLQPVQQWSSALVERGKPNRRVGQLELRSDEADAEPGRQHEADKPWLPLPAKPPRRQVADGGD